MDLGWHVTNDPAAPTELPRVPATPRGRPTPVLYERGKGLLAYDTNGREVRLRTDDPTQMDPGMAVPHVLEFSGLIRGAWNTYYREGQDEALRHHRENAMSMCLDEHLMACLSERAREVALLNWNIEPGDKKDLIAVAVASGVERVLRSIPRFDMLAYLMEKWATWYGRYGSQLSWEWKEMSLPQPGMGGGYLTGAVDAPTRALTVRRWLPTNGDKIGFTFDHRPMIRINAAYSNRFPKSEIVVDNLGHSLILSGGWRKRFVIHQSEPFDADWFENLAMDAVHGVGLRSWLYWSWWTRTEYMTSVVDALERYGTGFIALYYTAGNDTERQEALQVAKNYTRRSVLVVPRPQKGGDTGGVEVVETPTAGMQVLQALHQACLDREERLIIGQTGSSRSSTSGMGTHDPIMMQQTKANILKLGSRCLGESFTGSEEEPSLVHLVKTHTYPWARDIPLRFKYRVPEPDAEGRLGAATMAWNMGCKLKAEEVLEAAGFNTPGPEDETLMSPAFMQPPPGQGGQPGEGEPGADGQAPTEPPEGQGNEPDSTDPVFDRILAGHAAGGGHANPDFGEVRL